MPLVTTTVKKRGAKRTRKSGSEVFKDKIAQPNHMLKIRSGRKNQDIVIPKTQKRVPGKRAKRRKK